jgi:hypothetical protein
LNLPLSNFLKLRILGMGLESLPNMYEALGSSPILKKNIFFISTDENIDQDGLL